MAKITQIKTNFTAGEIAPDLLGRGDLRAYDNGALALRNLFIAPTGGIRRRAGTVYRATLPGVPRLVVYEYAVEAIYLLAITDHLTSVYQSGVLITSFATPWDEVQLGQLNFAQSADALLVVHPDIPPKRIMRSSTGVWSIGDWVWRMNGFLSQQPYYRFAHPDIMVFSPTTTGTATLTASGPVFTAAHVGVRLRIRTTECTITGYTSPITVTVNIHGTLAATPATLDWKEAAFSMLRGYPVAVAFHQDRLVIGGSRSLPNRLWLSQTGDLYNFDLGTGLDDQGIEFGILSDQVNAIRAVMSGRHLQVFTSGAEYMVTGDPLTPTNLQIKRQTRIGSAVDRTIAPVDVDGASLFVSRGRDEIREFLYTDIEQAYQATDLALLTRDMIAGAVDQDFDKARRLMFVVREDGRFATLTMFRPEQVAAWTLHDTQGLVNSVAVAGTQVFVAIKRDEAYYLEEFDDAVNLDSSIVATSLIPQTVWGGLAHLNGQTVKIVGDFVPQPDAVVDAGTVTLDIPVRHVQIGLAYTHRILPLPMNRVAISGGAHKMRLVRLTIRLQETQSLCLDCGRGLRHMVLPGGGAPVPFSGEVGVTGYGWHKSLDHRLWGIEDDQPLPFTLLSITTEAQVN